MRAEWQGTDGSIGTSSCLIRRVGKGHREGGVEDSGSPWQEVVAAPEAGLRVPCHPVSSAVLGS